MGNCLCHIFPVQCKKQIVQPTVMFFPLQSTMAACFWDLSLPLAIIIFLGIDISALPMTSLPPDIDPLEAVTLLGSPTEGFVLVSEDYEDYTVAPATPFVPKNGGEKCVYNHCLENEPPCFELATLTGCLCPGLTLHNVPPEVPELESVIWNGSDVIVKWCAPLSFITGYVVTVGGQEKHAFGSESRSGSIGEVENLVQVCVSAVNDAGESHASCTMYEPTETSVPLKVGLIVGFLGLLLLLILVVLVWRRRRQRKQEANISLGDTGYGQ